jgi:hypothetical protein
MPHVLPEGVGRGVFVVIVDDTIIDVPVSAPDSKLENTVVELRVPVTVGCSMLPPVCDPVIKIPVSVESTAVVLETAVDIKGVVVLVDRVSTKVPFVGNPVIETSVSVVLEVPVGIKVAVALNDSVSTKVPFVGNPVIETSVPAVPEKPSDVEVIVELVQLGEIVEPFVGAGIPVPTAPDPVRVAFDHGS